VRGGGAAQAGCVALEEGGQAGEDAVEACCFLGLVCGVPVGGWWC
jgi:hypothetical protein